MIVKYYGYGELPNTSGKHPFRNAVIIILRSTSPWFAARHLTGTPSACVWIVPGTVNADGFHVE